VPVELGQAGGQVVCGCGKSLQVPPFRQLRELPVESAEAPIGRRAWHPRNGVIAIGLIAAAALAAVSLWVHLKEPKPPKFDVAGAHRQLNDALEDLTPSAAWHWWVDRHSMLEEGFQVHPFRMSPADQDKLERSQFMKKALLVPAAVFIAIAIAAALWPSGGRP
jgi:hypothetical protein